MGMVMFGQGRAIIAVITDIHADRRGGSARYGWRFGDQGGDIAGAFNKQSRLRCAALRVNAGDAISKTGNPAEDESKLTQIASVLNAPGGLCTHLIGNNETGMPREAFERATGSLGQTDSMTIAGIRPILFRPDVQVKGGALPHHIKHDLMDLDAQLSDAQEPVLLFSHVMPGTCPGFLHKALAKEGVHDRRHSFFPKGAEMDEILKAHAGVLLGTVSGHLHRDVMDWPGEEQSYFRLGVHSATHEAGTGAARPTGATAFIDVDTVNRKTTIEICGHAPRKFSIPFPDNIKAQAAPPRPAVHLQ
jgi:hypothetical protein